MPKGVSLLVVMGTLLLCGGCESPPFELSRPETSSIARERLALNRRCEKCHEEIAAEWRSSRHGQSFTNAEFGHAYAIESDPFCSGCHAPEAPDPTVTELADQGVACVTCHVDTRGKILTSSASFWSSAPHAVFRTEQLSGSQACAACHEFAFPNPARQSREMMQTTISEHARSPYRDTPCSSCHMPKVGADRHRSHAFASTRDPEAIARALQVSARRAGTTAHLRLSSEKVGHAFPTGDLFRRVTVTVEARDDDQTVRRRERRYLTRHFRRRQQDDGRWFRVEVDDNRPGASPEQDGAVDVTLDLGEAATSRSLYWEVAYERVEHLRGDSQDEATVADRVIMAKGTLE